MPWLGCALDLAVDERKNLRCTHVKANVLSESRKLKHTHTHLHIVTPTHLQMKILLARVLFFFVSVTDRAVSKMWVQKDIKVRSKAMYHQNCKYKASVFHVSWRVFKNVLTVKVIIDCIFSCWDIVTYEVNHLLFT